MKLVILAGGKGTRLGFDGIPKPMVPIGEKSNLENQILLAKKFGITEIFLLTGHLAEVIFREFGDGSALGVKLVHVIEPFPLGTAGSLKMLEHVLHDRFMVFYGDVVMDIDLEAFMAFDQSSGASATLLTHPNDHPYDSDLIEADQNNVITAFLSKPHPEALLYNNLVNAAVYILSPEIFSYIDFGISQDFGKDIFPKMILAREKLVSYRSMEYVKDMGTKDRLPKVTNDWVTKKVARLNKKFSRPAVFLDRDGVINEFVDNLSSIEDFGLFPFAAEAIRLLNSSDFLPVVITNQPMIAKGFLSFEELDQIHKKMETLLGVEHAYLADTFYCPHHPDKGFEGERPELKVDCLCRKPGTALIEKAKELYNIDLSRSWFIGDSTLDIQTGKNAGMKSLLVRTGIAGTDRKYGAVPDAVQDNLLSAVRYILEQNSI